MALVGWWDLDEGSGDTLSDESGNANHGTRVGASWAAGAGPQGQDCLLFDGGTNRVTIPNHSSLNFSGTQAFTYAAWVKGNSATWTGTGHPAVFAYAANLMLTVEEGSRLIEAVLNDSTTPNGTTAITLGTWAHLAMTGDASTIRFYVNGDAAGTTSRPSISSSSVGCAIGHEFPATDATYGFAGHISQVRAYSHVLTEAEIEALMATDPVYEQSDFRIYNDDGSGLGEAP